MPIIELTNAHTSYAGKKLALNTDKIVSIYTENIDRGNNVVEVITYVHCPPHGTWEVQESFDQIMDKINGKKNWFCL